MVDFLVKTYYNRFMIYNFEDLSFKILRVSKGEHKDGFFNVAGRPYSAISYRLSGSALFDIDGKLIEIKAGDILYIPANTPYKVDYLGVSSIIVHLTDCNYLEAEKIKSRQPLVIESKFLKLLESWREERSNNSVKSCLYDIFARLEMENSFIENNFEFLDSVKYFEANYKNPNFNIEAICAALHVSRSSLQRYFNKRFGISPKQYLNKLRINNAVDMLSNGNVSVKQVAYLCGFTDEKYFSRLFKSVIGYPPSSFTR